MFSWRSSRIFYSKLDWRGQVIEKLPLPGLFLWMPKRFSDARGWFAETYSERTLEPYLGGVKFIQDNLSHSIPVGVVRGLHFQTPPSAQDKLVQVLRGAIRDVAVDLRRASPTYGRHLVLELSAETGTQLFLPKGFAHGFVTLKPDTEVLYKVSAFYDPKNDAGIHWRDPALGIDWGISEDAAIVSDKDKKLPTLASLPAYF
jgi:dTDP-4-dehydrorhamnose 3,5-epimerase